MGFSCKLCSKEVAISRSDCKETWEETLRAFFAVKGSVICDTCADEVYEQCFEQIKRGRKYIRIETKKRSAPYNINRKFNTEKRC